MADDGVDDIKHPKQPIASSRAVAAVGDYKSEPRVAVPTVVPSAPVTSLDVVNPLAGGAGTALPAERPLRTDFLATLATDTAVDRILLQCANGNTQLTSEQFLVLLHADKTFGFAGMDAETPVERASREARDKMLVTLVRECIVRFPEFSITRSMKQAASTKRYPYTETLLANLLKDQSAGLVKAISTELAPMTHATIVPNVFSPAGAQAIPPPVAPVAAREPMRLPPPAAAAIPRLARQRMTGAAAAASARESEAGTRKGCCGGRSWYAQHGTAVGTICALM